MPTALAVVFAWCALSVVFAGVHYRWVRYEAADPSPMDTLQVLPAYEPAPASAEVATLG
jgi:nitrate reductase gamma subunit